MSLNNIILTLFLYEMKDVCISSKSLNLCKASPLLLTTNLFSIFTYKSNLSQSCISRSCLFKISWKLNKTEYCCCATDQLAVSKFQVTAHALTQYLTCSTTSIIIMNIEHRTNMLWMMKVPASWILNKIVLKHQKWCIINIVGVNFLDCILHWLLIWHLKTADLNQSICPATLHFKTLILFEINVGV